MHRYVALLRGIAPSGPNMTNDKLRGVFEELGFADVASVLASGNILFRSVERDVPALEGRIEEALTRRLGIHSRTIVRDQAQLRSLADRDPFAGVTHGRGTYLTATFLKGDPGSPTPSFAPASARTDIVGYDADARAVLAVTDNSMPGRTPNLMAWLETVHGKGITTRSWPTVLRILGKLEG